MMLECPDCNSDLLVEIIAPSVYKLTVAHDDTCPWLAQHQRESQ